jgi:hypothetical protein
MDVVLGRDADGTVIRFAGVTATPSTGARYA